MSEEPQQANLDCWAVIEMMGHRKEIGHVTTQAFGQAILFRVDTPALDEREYTLTAPEYIGGSWTPAGAKVKRPARPARSCLIAPGSLYAINPCSEEAARSAIERLTNRPLILIDVPAGALVAAGEPDDFDDHDDEENAG